MRSVSASVKRDLRQEVTDSIAALEKGVDPCVALTGTGACHSAIHHRPLPAVGTLALSGVALNPDFSARPSACQSPRIAPPVCAGRETNALYIDSRGLRRIGQSFRGGYELD